MEQGISKHRSGNLIDRSGNLLNRSGILAEHGAALIHIANDAAPGRPLTDYLEGILAAAVATALPLAYRASWRVARKRGLLRRLSFTER
jgi:hypothetical protein